MTEKEFVSLCLGDLVVYIGKGGAYNGETFSVISIDLPYFQAELSNNRIRGWCHSTLFEYVSDFGPNHIIRILSSL